MGAGERERVSGRGRERERARKRDGEGRAEGVSKGGGRRETGLPSMETVLGRLILPIGEVKTPSPALCVVMDAGLGGGYLNGLATQCPDSVGFRIW